MNASRTLLRTILFLLLIAAGTSGIWGSEASAAWEKVYQQATNNEDRYDIMLKITALKDKDFGPLFASALLKLNSEKIEAGEPSIVQVKLSLAKLLIKELGTIGSLSNADLVYDVYRYSKDPLLRGEAALALGKMRAVKHVEKLARDLAALNVKPELDNPRSQETLAFGLVQSLEMLHSPDGFQPVFFAAIGWYSGSSQVKESARAALKTMLPDPSPQLKTILAKETILDRKLRVLEVTEESTAPSDAKLGLARIGLEQGLSSFSSDVATKRLLSDIRQKAIKILVANQDKAEESVGLYQRVLEMAFNTDELLLTYVAIARNASAPAVKLLIRQMTEYNTRQKSKINTDEDRKIIRQIIQSLAMTKSPLIKPVLTEALFVDHDGQVARDAKAVLDQIP